MSLLGHKPLRGACCSAYWLPLLFLDLITSGVFVIKSKMRSELFLFLLVYIFLLFLISFFFSKKMGSFEDFFLASRRLPGLLVYSSLVASWLGATSILVSTDEAYKYGVSSFWVMGVPAILTVLLFGFFLTRSIRRLPILSLPDLVELRYGRKVRHLASLLIIWYMVLLASSQMVAVGNFLKTLLATSYLNGLILGTSIVLLYSVLGGFFSVALTDSLQFFLLVMGILCLFFFLFSPSSLGEIALLGSRTGKLDYFNFFFNFKENVLIVVSFTLAWIISPIAWQRIQAARTEKAAKTALLFSSGTFFLVYGILVLVGMLCLPLFLSSSTEGPLLAKLISLKSGSFLSGLLFIAIVAAIMSTMDTAINTGALSVVRDGYQQIFSATPQAKIILVSRLSTILVGGAAFLVATKFQSILKALGLASEIMAEGLFIPGITMLFLRRKLAWAGFLSLTLGGGFSILSFLSHLKALPFYLPSWPYSVPYGVGLCLIGFVIGFIIDKHSGA